MGDTQYWGQFADQDFQEIRRTFLAERIRVSPERHIEHTYTRVAPTHWVPRDWYRSLGWNGQAVVRGAAVSAESRKAVLVGRWAAAQFGMWALPVKSAKVSCALPSGNVPSKSKWPEETKFLSMQIPADDVVELDGVRVTHPLRTVVDLLRFGDVASAYAAVSWLLKADVLREDMRAYFETFASPIRPIYLRNALNAADYAVRFHRFEDAIAWALLHVDGLRLQTHVRFEGMWTASIVVEGDLIIEVDTDPYHLSAASEFPELPRQRRERTRWVAAKGYRTLYFTLDEILRDPEGFVSEVRSARFLWLRG